MNRLTPLAPGETYHVYNRGAHKLDVFKNEKDYKRFLLLLRLANHNGPLNVRDILTKYKGRTFADIFLEEKPDESLVDVLAYALLPNHFHLVLRQKAEGGITAYMKRLSVAYSMYFNLTHEHSGVLFQGRFKSKHIDTEEYFRYIFSYVHLNPLDISEPDWKNIGIKDIAIAREHMNSYPYSSFYDYYVGDRPERVIVSFAETPEFLKSQNDFEELVRWGNQEN